MKKYSVLLAALLAFSLTSHASASSCTLLLDHTSNKVIVKKGDCDTRHSPASTFKIPLALMGYDSNILEDEQTPAWSYQEGYTLNKEDDKGVITPLLWEKNSVVWYSQKLTETMGAKDFKNYVDTFDYGNKDISGDAGKNNGLTHAWLSSSLQISPVEQVAFLKKFLDWNLNLSDKAYVLTMDIIPVFETENGWNVHGKTGTGSSLDSKGNPNKTIPGWFVGWAKKDDRRIIFAKLIVGAPSATPAGPKARQVFLKEFPQLVP